MDVIGTDSDKRPSVYLAHGSEDKETIVRPLANRLMAKGIDVWFDHWEIRAGDSLRQKMEEGLGRCTHFVVVLTPTSIRKPWVNAEIDAAFVRRLSGRSKLIALRCDVSVGDLSPFLAAQLSPEFRSDMDADFEALVADILGVSRKPALGPLPSYVTSVPQGLGGRSGAAAAVARYLVENSKTGMFGDPVASIDEVAKATGLPEDDVSDGVFELEEAGLVDVRRSLGNSQTPFHPRPALFMEFDRQFAGIDSKGDAVAIVSWLINVGERGARAADVAKQFPDWSQRRLNSALTYLEGRGAVLSSKAMDPEWVMSSFMLNDKSRRFAKENM